MSVKNCDVPPSPTIPIDMNRRFSTKSQTIAIDTIRRFSSTYVERRPSYYTKPRDSLVDDDYKPDDLLDIEASPKQTSYLETLTHYVKANLGTGLFAMGDAFKNGGLFLAPILTLIIALVALHTQHTLVCILFLL